MIKILSGLYAIYHKSPANRANLKSAFEVVVSQPSYPLRIRRRRWLSHTVRALEKPMEKTQSNHHASITNERKLKTPNTTAKATPLLKFLQSYEVIAFEQISFRCSYVHMPLLQALQKEDQVSTTVMNKSK